MTFPISPCPQPDENQRGSAELTTIPFNKPFVAGKELYYIAQAVTMGNLGGDGHFTQSCCRLMEDRFEVSKVLLTPSCTASLEMAASLCQLQADDEVIMPSYTFVSTASAFVREGAKPVFVDIRRDTLNIDESLVEQAITPRTKAICVVHYAGVACEMDAIMGIAKRHKLIVVEDAAQGVNAYYKGRALGSIGDLGCYSFHETKNYICGEGGALCVNNPELIERAEIIRDKGTNRQAFFRGQVDKYTWVDVGSSYVPSEICAAFLYGQLEEMDRISQRRKEIYQRYRDGLTNLMNYGVQFPVIPGNCGSNYHMFYVRMPTPHARQLTLEALNGDGIGAVFHYVPLHGSPMGRKLCGATSLPVSEHVSDRLIRLPFFFELSIDQQCRVMSRLNHHVSANLKEIRETH